MALLTSSQTLIDGYSLVLTGPVTITTEIQALNANIVWRIDSALPAAGMTGHLLKQGDTLTVPVLALTENFYADGPGLIAIT